ncbi:MAG: purine-binding chemotaxis protein CheW [Armatimonadetes bacterium]|nr:purine-binding chemotaxis protein CheW [Armatimonadota bacterium]
MNETKFVVFQLEGDKFGIPIDAVERIMADQKPTRIPRTPAMLLGVFDLRGEAVAAVDLRLRFDFPERPGTANFIVVTSERGRVALRVDKVDGIMALEEGSIEDSPEMLRTKDDDFMSGVAKNGEELIVLLEPDNVIPKSMRKTILKVEAAAA